MLGSLSLPACGGAPEDDAADVSTAQVESVLSTDTVNSPTLGECVTTLTLDKVVDASSQQVVRAACKMNCKKTGIIYARTTLYRSDQTAYNQVISPTLTGTIVSATADLPYSPGDWNAGCLVSWPQDASKAAQRITPAIYNVTF